MLFVFHFTQQIRRQTWQRQKLYSSFLWVLFVWINNFSLASANLRNTWMKCVQKQVRELCVFTQSWVSTLDVVISFLRETHEWNVCTSQRIFCLTQSWVFTSNADWFFSVKLFLFSKARYDFQQDLFADRIQQCCEMFGLGTSPLISLSGWSFSYCFTLSFDCQIYWCSWVFSDSSVF